MSIAVLARPQGRWTALRAACIALAAAVSVAGDVAAYGRHAARLDERPMRNVQASEALLVRTLFSIHEQRPGDALRDIDALLAANPDFELAHLIKGDLLLARSRAIRTVGDAAPAPVERIQALREEARARLARHNFQPPANLVPKYLLQMHAQQHYAVVVDTAKATLYLFENHAGRPRYASDYYVSVGKNGIDKLREGDKKTPLGVYRVLSEVPAQRLTDFYGAGAWPIDYPNEWDRRDGRKGHGIWLHGTPRGSYSRPPRASDGCVVLANDDLSVLGAKLQPGLTPVIIAEAVEWVDSAQAQALRNELSDTLERWRRDRSRDDTDAWLAHYARGFPIVDLQRERWAARQRDAFDAAAGPVMLSEVAMFLYPGRDDLAVVTFREDHSGQGKARSTRQYWVREFGLWKIAYEGAG